MAPARTDPPEDDSDPVTAEYNVYLTPSQTEQILLLQYPNRVRNRPYNARHGACPEDLRIKPNTGFLELDINMNTSYNFNKYKGLQWGDALGTARDVQNASGTYGPAAGFSGAKPRSAGRTLLRDRVDRDEKLTGDLANFYDAEVEEKVMRRQTLGGQIVRHDGKGEEEKGKPIYFVGAFRADELHLTRVDGTVQMRPQFHHLDAEEQRARLAASRPAPGTLEPGAGQQQVEARALLSRQKKTSIQEDEGAKDKLEDVHRKLLVQAEAEEWTKMEYVDEDMQESYDKFHERMFVKDVEGVEKLRSGMDSWEYLDAISAPRRESPGRRRKRPARRKQADEEDGDGEGGDAGVDGEQDGG